jgi:hypothetical protein
MVAYLVLLFAVLSRILPHALHVQTWNFTALGGGLLFFGAHLRGRGNGSNVLTSLKLASAVLVLMATDYYLTVYGYGFPFHIRGYIVTWVWYAAVCVLGMEILRKVSVLRVAAGVFASATSFFLLSNFVVWAGSNRMYPHTLAGLGACYIAGIPFYRNDLVSTAITAGALFGLPVLAAKIVDSVHAAQNDNLPTA